MRYLNGEPHGDKNVFGCKQRPYRSVSVAVSGFTSCFISFWEAIQHVLYKEKASLIDIHEGGVGWRLG